MRRTLLLSLLLAAPLPLYAQAPAASATAGTATEDARLLAFLDAGFDARIALSPETMTGLGLKTDYGKLDDYTGEDDRQSLALMEQQLAEMKRRFPLERLGPTGQLSYRLFENSVMRARDSIKWRDWGFPISTNGSPAGQIPVLLLNEHEVENVADAEAYISRLREVERVMREVSARVRAQADKGIVPPQMVFDPARRDTKAVLVGAPFDTSGKDSTVLADFRKKVDALSVPAAEKQRLITQASEALAGPFRRGYDTMLAALDAIEPKSKGNNGAWSLPEGEAFYAHRLRQNTTTDLTADQIHNIGLERVKALRAEMEAVKSRSGFNGTLQQYFAWFRTAPELKFPNTEAGREQYLAEARKAIADAMAIAPKWFSVLPKAPLEVRAVEKWRENTASVAFYNRPSADGTRPGIYYVNLADLTQVSKSQVEAIAYHEGAPGHHFQIARQQELQGIPKFRRFGGYSAYSEGWGLYSERLAKEMGFYHTPVAEMGMLSNEIWRAIRLVVDTGLHSKRWTREQAQQYFRDNSLVSEIDLVREVNRYINNPGQATSYMIGSLKIFELRDKAKKALGNRFDIRDFHEAVLANGAMPLNILEEQVDAYIAAKRA